jgi:hypothetical protein
LILTLIADSAAKCLSETAGAAKPVAQLPACKSITSSLEASSAMTRPRIWWLFVPGATTRSIEEFADFLVASHLTELPAVFRTPNNAWKADLGPSTLWGPG